MKDKMKNWLVIGIPKNWETAFSQPVPIWGLKPRYRSEFQYINVGDILWFYASKPISGIVGIGIVKDKYIDNINLIWPEEQERKEVIWPLRFRIHVLKVLSQPRWKIGKIKIYDFNLFWQIGFQLLSDNHVRELFDRAKIAWGITDADDIFVGATIAQPLLIFREEESLYKEEKLAVTHKDLQTKIAEIGKLQFYYTELEYSLKLQEEEKSLDVVWKREIDGVPTFAFEIELSGMIEKAIDRLIFAFKKWNSRPRIVVPERLVRKVHNIIGVSERDFLQSVKIYEPKQIIELLNKKLELKNVEQNLEIY